MRLCIRTILAVVIVCALSLADLEGKGRRGGKGHGQGAGKRSHISRKPIRGHDHPGRRLKDSGHVKPQKVTDKKTLRKKKVTGKKHALKVQRRNAERNLKQRQKTAQRLRDLSAKNGNERLLETADKMEQNAQQQYDKRLEKINASQDQSPDHHSDETIAP
ncbi:MAG: hypothetical protein IID46_09795 [Planctomycetes bacterium]|nr:hypothetical protein [Planctomycetota bacterium]